MPNYQMRADVFPASVRIKETAKPDEDAKVIDKARVIITLDHVYVFLDGVPEFETAFEDRLTSYTPPVKATRVKNAAQLLNRYATLETEDGYTVTFQRMSSCGCGSRLKNARLETLLPTTAIGQAASSNDS
jgi:hypothetical protein